MRRIRSGWRSRGVAALRESGMLLGVKAAALSLRRLGLRRVLIFSILAGALLAAPSVLKAQTPGQHPTVQGTVRAVTVDGRPGLEVTFPVDMVADKDLIYKNLGEEERPFRLSRPLDLKALWRSARVLRLEPQLSPREFEDALDKKPLDLIWKKNFKSVEGFQVVRIQTVSDSAARGMKPLLFHPTNINKNGEGYNRLDLEPFKLEMKAGGDGRQASLTFTFNRIMVEPEQVGRPLALDEAPFELEPPLDMKGGWKSQKSLSFNKYYTLADFWEEVSDVPFRLKWKNIKNIHGQPLPNSGRPDKFYFAKFSLVGFHQAAMHLDGWADFDLGFNKPVRPADLAGRLTVEKFVYGKGQTLPGTSDEKNSGYKAAEFKLVNESSGLDSDGTMARIKVRAGHGERIRLSLKNVKSADGRGLITQAGSDSWVDRFFTIADAGFEVEENYPWRTYFTINTRETLNFQDIEKYISLDPPLEFTVSPYGQEGNSIQIFAPFSSESDTRLTLKKGLPSQRGALPEDVSYTVSVPGDRDRKLMFTGRGRYLTPDKPLLVKLAGRNVKKVRLQAWRIYENNLPTIINIQDYDHNTRLRLAQQFSDNLLDRESETQAKPGQTFERLINLEGLLDERPRGAYILKCEAVKSPRGEGEAEDGAEDEYEDYYYESRYDYSDYYYHPERYLPVMISDLGLAAHVLPGRVAVWVNSLSALKAVGGGRVKFYDRANQVLAEGLTDSDGLFSAELNPDELVFVTVEKDGDLNYLTFGASARPSSADEDYGEEGDCCHDDYESVDWRENGDAKWYGGDGGYLAVSAPRSPYGPMRAYLTKGYEAFLFMPRDMFKPGETVAVKALVRDRDIEPPSPAFPVLWRIDDPDGKAVGQGRAEMNADGGLDFSAEIPFFARTGAYSASIYLPGSSQSLGKADFFVEDFVPPRLALDIKPERKFYQGTDPEINLEAEVKYLFGAPGADLNWELDAVVFPSAFNPEGWAGFDFSSSWAAFQTTRQPGAAKGRLDEKGRAVISYSPGLDVERLPSKTSIEFVFSAQEDGGRWNAKKARVDYFPQNLILGSKAPDAPLVKQPFDFEVAAVTPEGGPAVDTPELTVRVFRVVSRYYNTYRYGRHYRQATEELVEKSVERVSLKEGRGRLSHTPETAGTYEIHISDEDSGRTLVRRVQVYGLAADREALSARAPVEITFDREHYRPGDRAKVKIKSPFAGRLWLTVESTELLHSLSRDMNAEEIELEIPVDKGLKTNAQVTATVVRPLAGDRTVFRAIGLASLEIDRSIYRLDVAAEMDERIKPAAGAVLKIRVTDAEGRPARGEATVALVDEGVLSLSNFKTPEPWRLFTAGRTLATRFYDLYDQLLPLEGGLIPFLAPGGGDGLGRSGLFSPFKRNQEILSIFLPSVKLDAQGEAEVRLDIPEYSGQGRLMVVAASGGRFGSLARDIRISRDLTAEATLPLGLAPGDRFEIPVRLFLAAEAPPEAGAGSEISCRTEGPIRLLGESTAAFDLQPGQGRGTVFQAVAEPADENGERAGVGRLIIDSHSGHGEAFSQSVEVVVRPPYPRISKSFGLQLEEPETEIVIATEGFLKGTVEASLTLAKSPAIEAARAVAWLREYPYGCLEQTTSKAWAYVAADDILQGLEPPEEAERNIFNGLNTAVQRLSSMQTVNGGFASWPGGNRVYDWASVYAIHFLTEAEQDLELPRNLKARSLDWLRNYLGSGYSGSPDDVSYILSTKAYALYVLALNGQFESGWYNSLRDRYDGLSPSARIFLAGAEALRDGNSQSLAKLEKEKLDLSYNTLAARVSSLDSGPRNLALKLLVWSEVDPLSETAGELARQVAEQGRNRLWSNTQENGLALLALGKYLSKSGLGRPYQATLSRPDGGLIFTAGPADQASAGPKTLAPWLDQKLRLKVEGEGRPYYSLTVGGVPLTPPEPKAEGLKLSRTWRQGETELPLNRPEDLGKILVFDKGERVTVEIVVEAAKPIQNLVLVDILPGGFEIENPRLVSPAEGESRSAADEPAEEARLEMREDRLVIIEPWIGGGRRVYRYGLRAVSSGEFVLPGTTAEGMYEPDRQAILPGGRVRVK